VIAMSPPFVVNTAGTSTSLPPGAQPSLRCALKRPSVHD
jgi:hypothetical protein